MKVNSPYSLRKGLGGEQQGSSWSMLTITTTLEKLHTLFGKPTYEDNSGDSKVNFEWVLKDPNNNVITIYDIRYYRKLEMDEEIEFHIGCRGWKENAEKAVDYINRKLREL